MGGAESMHQKANCERCSVCVRPPTWLGSGVGVGVGVRVKVRGKGY